MLKKALKKVLKSRYLLKKGLKKLCCSKKEPKKVSRSKKEQFYPKKDFKKWFAQKSWVKKIGKGKKDLIKEWQCVFQFSHNLFHPISCFLGGTVEIGQHSRDEASLIGDSTYGRFQKPMSRVPPPPLKIQKKSFILDFSCQPLRRVPFVLCLGLSIF